MTKMIPLQELAGIVSAAVAAVTIQEIKPYVCHQTGDILPFIFPIRLVVWVAARTPYPELVRVSRSALCAGQARYPP
jgi:hypothetical protein